jgi:hypothetical protein
VAADGDGLAVVEFESHETAAAWRAHPEHREAQRLGRERWFAEYRDYRLRRSPRLLVQGLTRSIARKRKTCTKFSKRFTRHPRTAPGRRAMGLRRGQDVPGSVIVNRSLTICPGGIDQNEPLGSDRAKRKIEKMNKKTYC